MVTKKEGIWIIIFILIMWFILSFPSFLETQIPNWHLLLISAIIILTSIFIKKLASKYFYLKIEHRPWGWQRYGWYERSHLKKPVPLGLILPLFLSVFSIGIIRMFAFFEFTAEKSEKKVLRKRGLHRREEINESDMAFVAAWGFLWLIVLAIIGSIFKQPELTKYSVYYGLWNLLPIGWLDGSRLFYGSFFNWFLITIIYLVSLVIVIL